MKALLLISLLSASCSQLPQARSYYTESRVIGVKCPTNYYYSFKTSLCHFEPGTARVVTTKPLKAQKTTVFKAKIDCKRVFKDINSCMKGE